MKGAVCSEAFVTGQDSSVWKEAALKERWRLWFILIYTWWIKHKVLPWDPVVIKIFKKMKIFQHRGIMKVDWFTAIQTVEKPLRSVCSPAWGHHYKHPGFSVNQCGDKCHNQCVIHISQTLALWEGGGCKKGQLQQRLSLNHKCDH